jgi:esterase/lipase superfamily enzyme
MNNKVKKSVFDSAYELMRSVGTEFRGRKQVLRQETDGSQIQLNLMDVFPRSGREIAEIIAQFSGAASIDFFSIGDSFAPDSDIKWHSLSLSRKSNSDKKKWTVVIKEPPSEHAAERDAWINYFEVFEACRLALYDNYSQTLPINTNSLIKLISGINAGDWGEFEAGREPGTENLLDGAATVCALFLLLQRKGSFRFSTDSLVVSLFSGETENLSLKLKVPSLVLSAMSENAHILDLLANVSDVIDDPWMDIERTKEEFDKPVPSPRPGLWPPVASAPAPLPMAPEPPPPASFGTNDPVDLMNKYQPFDGGEAVVWFATDRAPLYNKSKIVGFDKTRSHSLSYGACIVKVPKSHKIGSTGSPWWLRWFDDDRLHISSIFNLTVPSFWSGFSQSMRSDLSENKIAVLYVHGYNNTFESSIIRAAQIGYDLGLEGGIVSYCWPSSGHLCGYFRDECEIEASEENFINFLHDLKHKSKADKIHIIAHSMGNRLLMRALNGISNGSYGFAKNEVVFSQAILAAPDIYHEPFRNFSRAFKSLFARCTLYVSQRDSAILISKAIHASPRVGIYPPIFVQKGIDTVCTTKVDMSILGHGYYADSRPVLTDIHSLIMKEAPPMSRMGLAQKSSGSGEMYWEFLS